MIQWDYPPRCLSPHVSAARSHCEPLSWNAPESEEGPSRPVRWTCDCNPVFYELCQTGDRMFIRRTERRQGRRLIVESHRWPAPEADGVWNALLCGLVR